MLLSSSNRGSGPVRHDCSDTTGPARRREVAARFLIRRENRRNRANFDAHVGDDVPVHRLEFGYARAVILDDPTMAAIHVVAAKNLENDVLGAYPVGPVPG